MQYLLSLLLIFLVSCGEESFHYQQDDVIISGKNKGVHSTTAGNLVTTAVRRVHGLDAVLYPTEFIRENQVGLFSKSLKSSDVSEILSVFSNGGKDILRVGNMKGKDIKTFIRQRTLEKFAVDLETAGVHYDIMHKGGVIISEQYGFDNGPLQDNKNYMVAISDYYIRPGDVFPPYEFRNNIDRLFSETSVTLSVSESVQEFLKEKMTVPLLTLKRARVKKTSSINRGFKKISEIQGINFMSPFYGDTVTTQGIVTAAAKVENFPYGYIAYIQSKASDNDIRTSEAIKLYFDEDPSLTPGDLIQVSGTVYEEGGNQTNSLTATSIREITNLKKLSSGHSLPEAILIGKGGRVIPDHHFSTFVGDLNQKPSLKVKDALDFYESLEGMRVKIRNPQITGFRGGKENFGEEKPHITLYVLAENTTKKLSPRGGAVAEPDKEQFNPDILPMASTDITSTDTIKTSYAYKVGDKITGEIEGMITFTKNLFGDGEFLFQVPQSSAALDNFYTTKSETIINISARPKITPNTVERNLTIASYNIKNLSAIKKDEKRLKETSRMINLNLSCPDILGLVEVQDNNGETFSGGSVAEETIAKMIRFIPKTGPCADVDYQSININPLSHREGGVPGANIRVALIYNQNHVGFKENPAPTPLTETLITPNGHLNFNPGRIYPNSEAFQNTRKSIIAEFTFKGEPVFVVVNHFNSKLGDTSHYSAIHPIVRDSEIKRSKMAQAVNTFVSRIEKRNKRANIAVIGDFNAYVNEFPMKFLEANNLFNLMRWLPKNRWYTTNHNGNSQSLDYIFVNKNLEKKTQGFQVLQLNSDYMGKLSDHDPIISIFKF